ncbi:MAG: ABC transporter substrate-binding protein, partial [Candidatus Competibacterales bacterium]
ALALALGFPAFAADPPTPGGTLIMAVANTPRPLNPPLQSGIATGMVGTQLFATPLRFDENWNPEPYLAESWAVADDGLSVTLTLVEGATFHDGQPITSKDVAFSVATVQANHPFKTMFAPVETVETPDPRTAILRLSQPHPAILLAMSSQLLPIIPEHIYGDGQDPKTHPRNSADVVGSGPFKLAEYRPGEYIDLVRNEDYFIPNRPYLDRIVMRIIKDSQAHVLALEGNEAHLSPFMAQPRDLNRLQRADHLTITPKGYAAIGPLNWLAFNLKRPPLDDVRGRQAIAYGIDGNFITKALMLGLAQPATGPLVPDNPFYTPKVQTYDLDLDRANALLDEAGHPRGDDDMRFGLTVDYIPGAAMHKEMAEYLKPQLKKIGIDVTVRPAPDFPTWARRVGGHDFDLSWDIVFHWGDPVIGVHRTYISDNIRQGVIWSNTQSYSNPQVDDLLAEAAVALDPDQRSALYREFQQITAAELPVYWTHVLPYHTVHHVNLGNPPQSIWGACGPLDEVYWKAPPN